MTAEQKTMRLSQSPIISRGGLSGRVYVSTDYTVLNAETGLVETHAKVDITDALAAFLTSERAS